ncbi:hypothetical protein D9M72_569480 [compost metagenome]
MVRKPPPLMAPEIVWLKLPVSMTGSLLPVMRIALARVRPSALKPSVVPSSIASSPVPNALLWPRFRRPCLSAVPPL